MDKLDKCIGLLQREFFKLQRKAQSKMIQTRKLLAAKPQWKLLDHHDLTMSQKFYNLKKIYIKNDVTGVDICVSVQAQVKSPS